MTVLLSGLLAGVLAAAGAVAAPLVPSRELQPSDHRAIVTLVLNETPAGERLVIVQDDDVLVAERDLTEAGLASLPGRLEDVAGTVFLSLRSAGPRLTYQLDESTLELRITADPSLFPTRRLSLRPGEPAGTRHPRSAGAFFNYSAALSRRTQKSFAGELGASAGGALFTTTASWVQGGTLVRGLTSVALDQPQRMVRVTVGDTVARSGPLAGSALVAGVSVGREFGLNPYFSRFPSPTLSATATTPSDVEVYVDDRLVQRTTAAPGMLDLSGLATTSGPGRTRMLMRDAFGRVSEFSADYYAAASALARGLHDFHYAVGFQRRTAAGGRAEYGEPVAMGTHRLGVTTNLTLGGSFQASRHLLNAGSFALFSVRRMGQLELNGSYTTAGGESGRAGSVSWSYAGHPASAGVTVRAATTPYTSIGATRSATRFDESAFVGVTLGSRTSLTLQQHHRDSTTAGGEEIPAHRLSAMTTTQFGQRAHLIVNAGTSWSNGARQADLFVGLSFHVGARGSAMVADERRNGSAHRSIDVQRSRPVGEGFGYRFRTTDGTQRADGSLQYSGRRGLYELETLGTGDSMAGTARVSGGTIISRRGLAFSRTVEQGYAEVSVPGLRDVRVRVNNVEVGRTNAQGRLVIPSLLSNYANRISIDDLDLPEGVIVPEPAQLVAPAYRSAANVVFRASRLQGASGLVVVDASGDEPRVPAGGLLSVDGGIAQSPIGMNGEFFFEQLAPGRHLGELRYLGRAYSVHLIVPTVSTPWAELGTLSASPADRGAERIDDWHPTSE